jgi:hypothetical protein
VLLVSGLRTPIVNLCAIIPSNIFKMGLVFGYFWVNYPPTEVGGL